MNLENNRIADFGAIRVPRLTYLNLNKNKIEKMDTFEGHDKLKIL